MLQMGSNRLVFARNIVGIFSVDEKGDAWSGEYECVTPPPYKSYIVVYDGDTDKTKAYFTSLSVRSLLSRVKNSNRINIEKYRKECEDIV